MRQISSHLSYKKLDKFTVKLKIKYKSPPFLKLEGLVGICKFNKLSGCLYNVITNLFLLAVFFSKTFGIGGNFYICSHQCGNHWPHMAAVDMKYTL